MRFLLVPGAGGAASYWYRVVELLERRGHRAVAVDLPADDPDLGLPEYVDLEVAAAGALPTGGPLVVVAQSLGGFSGPIAAGRLGAAAIVLVNAMVPAAGESAGEWWSVTGHAEAMSANDRLEGRNPDVTVGSADFDAETYFLHDVPDDVRAAGADGRAQSGTVFQAPFPDWPEIPVHVLSGADDRLFPLAFQQQVARQRLGQEPVVVPGGHLVALSRPAELVQAVLDLTAALDDA